MAVNDRIYIVEGVSARVNEETGEQFFAPATVESIQQITVGNAQFLGAILICLPPYASLFSASDDADMTASIDDIQQKIADDQFEFSRHAVDQSILRKIRVQEVREAIANGRIIEDYPEDKYGPSCLICGVTIIGRFLHIQCSYPSRPLIKIITLHQPNPTIWTKCFTERRKYSV
jgi:hypothetical protein